MAYMDEVTAYKARMFEAFCMSDEIFRLLQPMCTVEGSTEEDSDTHLTDSVIKERKDLMYTRVFPYLYIPEATEVGRSYVCFDLRIPSIVNDTIKNLEIIVLVMAHQSLMRLPNSEGIRIDVMAANVDRLLNGNRFGLGTIEAVSNNPIRPITGYHGRELIYRVKEINRSPCGWGDRFGN